MTYIGDDYLTGKPVHIDLSAHVGIVGGSGMGKSTLLANLYTDRVRSGAGVGLIDPHGDLADLATRSHPISRMWDFMYQDPDASSILPMNPFYFKDADDLELGKDGYFQMKKSLAGAAWGDESARVTINAIDAVCAKFKHPSPVHEFRFMGDKDFRTKVLADTEDPFLTMFQKQYDNEGGNGLRPSDTMAKFSPPMNKTGKMMRPRLLPIIGCERSIDCLEIMNKSRVIVFRLPKGRGEEDAIIIGSIVINLFSISALRREKQRERPPFYLFVDEAPNFAHGGRFSSILAEGRKYAITGILAFQGTYQIPFARDMLSNCPTQIVFNCSGEDAEAMAKNWGEPDLARQITDLPRYRFFVRYFNADNQPIVKLVNAAPPIKRRGDEARPTKLIKHSLERYGIDRDEVITKILRFLRN